MSLPGKILKIKTSFDELECHDRDCATQKDKVEAELKALTNQSQLLEWIIGKTHHEESHTNMKCQTGIGDSGTKAAAWFIDTWKFQSWVARLSRGETAEHVYWLNGISKTPPAECTHVLTAFNSLIIAQWVPGRQHSCKFPSFLALEV